MQTKINSGRLNGIEAVKTTIETAITSGIGIHLVGLPDTAVKESLLRTATALQSLGYSIPGKKIVINIVPSDLHRSGTQYDLPIALGILAASEQVSLPLLDKYLIAGELGLDASVRPVRGGLVLADYAARNGYKGVILPTESALEASDMEGIEVYGVNTIVDAMRILGGREEADDLLIRNTEAYRKADPDMHVIPVDFEDIAQNETAKRGLEIAAAGGHNILMLGPECIGKTLLARTLSGILPPMTEEEAAETAKTRSAIGTAGISTTVRSRKRLFHTANYFSASLPELIGGGPGESVLPGHVSFAHNGVLYLYGYDKFPASAREALRAALEDGKVTIRRLHSRTEYPASFTMIASVDTPLNPSDDERERLAERLSGPLADKIDIQVIARPYATFPKTGKPESSATVAKRVQKAREMQARRFKGTDISCNARMTPSQAEKFCPLADGCKDLLERLFEGLLIPATSYYKVLKIARTIADLDSSEMIEDRHLAEAVSYRFMDK